MNVTAMLAWYKEDLPLLRDCIRSLAGLCNRLVAVDGGYRQIPGATGSSGRYEQMIVRQAAAEAGLRLDLHVPDGPWPGQVAKRDFMIKEATLELTPQDWLLVVDADYRLHHDTAAVRQELEQNTTADALEVDFWTPHPEGFDLEQAPHQWHRDLAGETIRHTLLLRAWPDPRLEDHHWYYSAVKHGRRTALLGCSDYPEGVTEQLQSRLLVEHRCFERSLALLERNRDYCTVRDELVELTGVEP